MNNMECAVRCLESHREARGWTDSAVATDLLAQLGLDPEGEAKNAVVPVDSTFCKTFQAFSEISPRSREATRPTINSAGAGNFDS